MTQHRVIHLLFMTADTRLYTLCIVVALVFSMHTPSYALESPRRAPASAIFPANTPYRGILPNGASIEVHGVCERYLRAGARWWAPNGGVCEIQVEEGGSYIEENGRRDLHLLVETRDWPENEKLRGIKIMGSDGACWNEVRVKKLDRKDSRWFIVGGSVDVDAATCSLGCDIDRPRVIPIESFTEMRGFIAMTPYGNSVLVAPSRHRDGVCVAIASNEPYANFEVTAECVGEEIPFVTVSQAYTGNHSLMQKSFPLGTKQKQPERFNLKFREGSFQLVVQHIRTRPSLTDMQPTGRP